MLLSAESIERFEQNVSVRSLRTMKGFRAGYLRTKFDILTPSNISRVQDILYFSTPGYVEMHAGAGERKYSIRYYFYDGYRRRPMEQALGGNSTIERVFNSKPFRQLYFVVLSDNRKVVPRSFNRIYFLRIGCQIRGK